MRDFSAPRLGTGVHTGDFGGKERRRWGFFGSGEPVRWDVLFPRGRKGMWRRIGCVGVAVALAAGGVILWLTLRSDPSAPPDGGDPSLNGAVPSETTEAVWDTSDTLLGEETDGYPDTESPSAEPPTEDTASPDDTAEETLSADTEEATSETLPEEQESIITPADTEEGPRPVPEGCYPIRPTDVSESERGSGYLTGETADLPTVLSRDELWTDETPPTVLLIHTHPFEGYGDGKAWYDPASGGLAQTDTAYDSEGIVALGATLARSLREMGVTVMHLRIAVSEEDTAAEIYERTREAVHSYLTLYPDIGLILNLRRSAELTEDGSILRTAGKLDGETCAQIRISVSGDRPDGLLSRDLSAALALREILWEASPTVSRPVWVKTGSGILGEREGACALTLELGSAGNTFSEASRLTTALAQAVNQLIGGAES